MEIYKLYEKGEKRPRMLDNEYIRYVVKMRNGGYMKQEWDGALDKVKLDTVYNPLDATQLTRNSEAYRCINEIVTKTSNLPVSYDEKNPPVEVIELLFKISEL